MSNLMQIQPLSMPPAMQASNVVSMFSRSRPQSKADGVFATINKFARDRGVKNHMAYQYARQAKKDYLTGPRSAEQVIADWQAVLRNVTSQVRA